MVNTKMAINKLQKYNNVIINRIVLNYGTPPFATIALIKKETKPFHIIHMENGKHVMCNIVYFIALK